MVVAFNTDPPAKTPQYCPALLNVDDVSEDMN
jgi:hypothetical protein